MKNMENAEGTETTDKVRKTGKLDEKLLPPDKLVLPKASTPQNQNKLNMTSGGNSHCGSDRCDCDSYGSKW